MREKFIVVGLCFMLVSTTIHGFITKDIAAITIPPKPDLPTSILDIDEIYNVTVNLSNKIYNAYELEEYRKGRFFGSNGERASAAYLTYLMSEIGFYDPTNNNYSEDIDGEDQSYLESLGCSLTITNLSNASMNNVSVDCYISPRWSKEGIGNAHVPPPLLRNQLNGTYTYSNLKVLNAPREITDFLQDCLLNCTIFNFEKLFDNFSYNESDYDFFINAFEEYYNFTFEDIEVHPENASTLPWYNETLFGLLDDYVIIQEDPDSIRRELLLR